MKTPARPKVQVPSMLKSIQNWFGAIIERPFSPCNRMNLISPTGHPMEEEAALYIAPSPTLRPHQRIELYNQQYWWRLISIMQDNFPFLTHLLGYATFNRVIAEPFICHYRPHHWSLAHLGAKLPDYLEDHYHEENRELVLDTTAVDLATTQVFFAKPQPTLGLTLKSRQDLEALLSKKLYLQRNAVLFDLPYHIFHFRDALMQEDADHWLEHPLPPLEKGRRFHFLMFRLKGGRSNWRELTALKHAFLQRFENGSTADAACEWIQEQGVKEQEDAAAHLHFWLQESLINQWLSTTRPPTW